MQAIDTEPTFDLLDGLDGLSLLEESFVRKVDVNVPQQRWNRDILPAKGLTSNNVAPTDDTELWQALLLEQRSNYEAQIARLRADIDNLQKTVKVTEKESNGHQVKKQKWERYSRILDAYFDEYNIRI